MTAKTTAPARPGGAAPGSRPRPGRTRSSRALTAVALTVAALTSAACSGPSPATDAVTASVDPAAAAAQDAAFTTAMFEHRHQAVQLLGLVAAKADRSDVLQHAGDLQISYTSQMRELEGMLTAWGQPVPHVEGHTDLGEDIPGLLDSARLAELRAAAPAQFEEQYLAILSTHQKAAVPLAEQQLRGGADQQATAYARQVLQDTATQLAEIDRLAQS